VTASCIQPMSKSCCVRILVICVRNQNVFSSGNWGHREAYPFDTMVILVVCEWGLLCTREPVCRAGSRHGGWQLSKDYSNSSFTYGSRGIECIIAVHLSPKSTGPEQKCRTSQVSA
jgi:hypothetical protein